MADESVAPMQTSTASNKIDFSKINWKDLLFDSFPVTLGATDFKRKTRQLIVWAVHLLMFLSISVCIVGGMWCIHLVETKIPNKTIADSKASFYMIRACYLVVLVWGAILAAHVAAIFVVNVIYRTFVAHLIVFLTLNSLLISWAFADMFKSGLPISLIVWAVLGVVFIVHTVVVIGWSLRQSKTATRAADDGDGDFFRTN